MENVPSSQFMLDWWKCYLNSCATYHSFFVGEFLSGVHKGKSTMNGGCNTGKVSTSTMGWYGNFEVWLNKRGIENLVSIPMLEVAGYRVSNHTHGKWVVPSLKGKTITFE